MKGVDGEFLLSRVSQLSELVGEAVGHIQPNMVLSSPVWHGEHRGIHEETVCEPMLV